MKRERKMNIEKILEFIDKESQDWIKYLDDVIIPRLDYGTGKGITALSKIPAAL